MLQKLLTNTLSCYHVALKPKLYLFAGEGVQIQGILDDVSPLLRNQVTHLAYKIIGVDLEDVTYKTNRNHILNEPEFAQPLTLISQYVHFHHKKYDMKMMTQDYMVGYGIGEISALINSGSFSLAEGLKLACERGKIIKQIRKIGYSVLQIIMPFGKEDYIKEEITKYNLEVSGYNSPTIILVCGVRSKLLELSLDFQNKGISCKLLDQSSSINSQAVKKFNQSYIQRINWINYWTPKCNIIRNYDCKVYRSPSTIREGLQKQPNSPTQFLQSIKMVPPEATLIQVGPEPKIKKQVEEIRATMAKELPKKHVFVYGY